MEDNSKIRVMVIDEQPFFRAGVAQALSDNNFEILPTDTRKDPLEQVESKMPDVVLLGSDLIAYSGLDLGRRIVRTFPNTKVIILSPNPNDTELFECIRTAAVACLKKSSTAEELVETIRRANRGEYPINESLMSSPNLAKQVLAQFQDVSMLGKDASNFVTPLTNREKQILTLIANGNTNKQIANSLEISEQTIKNHVSAILRKLNANDRAHAVVVAIRCGLINI
ncbi:response regulator transcription factor [Dehalococcoides sp. THU3]|uniref:DNA-binding response regulator, LuxR family n=1 Tax=Dehalococcoides mccartyi (strain VS) TaxID=311424 RepID=D2BIU6_DEHMV|nr:MULTISPECIES: response regulator transcription factor [Dehalococcoides]ACZ62246.1 DNA-binding response regulator, LuxR family [Dehalococcoides mccartyi VS]QYY57701.1 response regulator transcription factor [Dehalococcoides mccartyi]BAQ35071.1 putative response regulator [Dehalococcoides sp. UCH007]